ncbi:hypothetical protein STTU_4243 [Streptomyces sp. Tu6071]|nr:hypothetical protein STTU_4243 [Streptomyces sp. Tu6071]
MTTFSSEHGTDSNADDCPRSPLSAELRKLSMSGPGKWYTGSYAAAGGGHGNGPPLRRDGPMPRPIR